MLLLLSWTGRAFNEEIGILEFSRASFPTLDEILAEDTHSTVKKKKVGVVQRTRVVLERRGVDTVHIGKWELSSQ